MKSSVRIALVALSARPPGVNELCVCVCIQRSNCNSGFFEKRLYFESAQESCSQNLALKKG